MKPLIASRRTFGYLLLGSAAAIATGGPTLAGGTEPLGIDRSYVELRRNALGVETLRPRFRWTLRANGGAHDKHQTAIRLRVIDHASKLIFDSRKLTTKRLHYTPRTDIPLRTQRRYDWFLTIWDETGRPSTEVHAGRFVTGLLPDTERNALWIAAEPQGAPYMQPTWANHPDSAHLVHPPIFRKQFWLITKPVTAVLSIAGLGQYQLFLNGEQVSENAMNGAWTDYSVRRQNI